MPQILQRPKANNAVPNFSILQECYLAWKFLSDLERYYPDFKYWFFNKVCPDLATGRRKILVKKSGDQVIAVAILKKYVEETKICTFRVSESAKRNGVGTKLMIESLEWLECSQPLITVNEEHASEFEGFLRKFHFPKTTTLTGLYRHNKKEVIYNAPITSLETKLTFNFPTRLILSQGIKSTEQIAKSRKFSRVTSRAERLHLR